MALLSLAAAVGTFSLRESWVLRDIRAGALDPRTPAGFASVRRMLLALWTLLAAAALLVLHAPRRWLFTAP